MGARWVCGSMLGKEAQYGSYTFQMNGKYVRRLILTASIISWSQINKNMYIVAKKLMLKDNINLFLAFDIINR